MELKFDLMTCYFGTGPTFYQHYPFTSVAGCLDYLARIICLFLLAILSPTVSSTLRAGHLSHC